jgi:hypothetical protein
MNERLQKKYQNLSNSRNKAKRYDSNGTQTLNKIMRRIQGKIKRGEILSESEKSFYDNPNHEKAISLDY